MIDVGESTRRFRVHARHTDSHHARLVEEASFEAAAVAYLEGFDLPAPTEGGGGSHLIVHDVGTGQEHCFRMDPENGEATSRGPDRTNRLMSR